MRHSVRNTSRPGGQSKAGFSFHIENTGKLDLGRFRNRRGCRQTCDRGKLRPARRAFVVGSRPADGADDEAVGWFGLDSRGKAP